MSIYMNAGWWGRKDKVAHFFPNPMAETSACNREFSLEGWLDKHSSKKLKKCAQCVAALPEGEER